MKRLSRLAVSSMIATAGVVSALFSMPPATAASVHSANDFRSPASSSALKGALSDIGYPKWWPVPETVSADTVVDFLRDAGLAIGTNEVSESYSTSYFESGADAGTVLDRLHKEIPIDSFGADKPEVVTATKNDLAESTITEKYRNDVRGSILTLAVETIDEEGPPAKKGVLYGITYDGPLGQGTLFPSEADWAWRNQLPTPPKGALLAEASLQLNRFDSERAVVSSIRYQDVKAIPALTKDLSKKANWKRGAAFVSAKKGYGKDTNISFKIGPRIGTMNLDARTIRVTMPLP